MSARDRLFELFHADVPQDAARKAIDAYRAEILREAAEKIQRKHDRIRKEKWQSWIGRAGVLTGLVIARNTIRPEETS